MAPQEYEQKGVEPVSLERFRTLFVQTVYILLGIQIHYVLFGRQFVCVDWALACGKKSMHQGRLCS